MTTFVFVDGVDGVGKTYFAERLSKLISDKAVCLPIIAYSSAIPYQAYKNGSHKPEEAFGLLSSLILTSLKEIVQKNKHMDYVVIDRGIITTYAYNVFNAKVKLNDFIEFSDKVVEILGSMPYLIHLVADSELIDKRLAAKGMDAMDEWSIKNRVSLKEGYRTYANSRTIPDEFGFSNIHYTTTIDVSIQDHIGDHLHRALSFISNK